MPDEHPIKKQLPPIPGRKKLTIDFFYSDMSDFDALEIILQGVKAEWESNPKTIDKTLDLGNFSFKAVGRK